MTRERWARIDGLYHAALEQPRQDRAAFLRREVDGDVDLLAEIEALLAYDERTAAFTELSAMELAARALVAPDQPEAEAYSGTIGSYEVLRLLGTGGMGHVYLAHDSRLARYAAVKVLRPDLADPEWIAAFRQEALAASGLNHPNILTIYEIGEQDGTSFIAAEYVDGVTLRARLKQAPLATLELVGIALQIGEGLAAAHERGVVHRDIKPENVMLRADDLVKILDFGIATRTDADASLRPWDFAGSDGSVIGTTGYMSPEQRQGRAVDARTDVWSLGVVMYEMATGLLPASVAVANEEDDLSVQNAIAIGLDELARLPPELAPIVGRALSQHDRYATAGELARDLRLLRRRLEESPADVAGSSLAKGPRTGGLSTWSRVGAAALVLLAGSALFAVVAGGNRETSALASIGIMPIKNEGEVSDGAYLADGIAASLRSRLAQFSSIRQAAASEAARLERLGVSPAEAGREMGVAAVLTGRLERHADSVIVRLALLQSADGVELWKRQFVRPIDDVLTLQIEIAREFVEELGLSPRLPLAYAETRDPAAYQLYAKGRYHVYRRTPDDLRTGLEYLREAVRLDPRYGRAHAVLADAHILLAMASDVAPKVSFPQARAAAERALAIDPELSEARVSMGIIKFWFDWDWSGAAAEFRRAIAAKQPDPAAHTFYGHLLSNLGDHTGALQEMRRALDYEPHSPLINALFAQCLYYQGRDDDALAHLQKALDLDPRLWLTHNMLGRIYARKGMYREALQALDKATGLGGNRHKARAVLEELKVRAAQTYVPPSNFALVHLGLGEHDEALDRLEEALEARDMLLTFLTVEPRWADLDDNPRFTALLGRIGLKR